MESSAAETLVASEIRKRKLALRALQRQGADGDEIVIKQSQITELMEKYISVSDGKTYVDSNEHIAIDFCDEFFYELMKNDRNEISISKFYDIDACLNVVGCDKFLGKLNIVNSIMDKYHDLRIEQYVEKISLDESLCKGGKIHFDCVSRIKLNDDEPRKILQMIDLVKSTLPTTYPYVIKREFFIVQDARPLYHWPEKKIELTNHDNWEPQFKPKVIERPKSATVVVEAAAAVPVEAKEEEEGEDSGNEDEDALDDGSLLEVNDNTQEVQQQEEELYTGEEGLEREDEEMDVIPAYDKQEQKILQEEENEGLMVEEEGLEEENEDLDENVNIPVE